jgi:hypothetical protein
MARAIEQNNTKGFVQLFTKYKPNFNYNNPTNAYYAIEKTLSPNALKRRANARAAQTAAQAAANRNRNAKLEAQLIAAGLPFIDLKAAIRNYNSAAANKIYANGRFTWPKEPLFALARRRIANIPRLQPLPSRASVY